MQSYGGRDADTGVLKALGMTALWQCAFMIPEDYDDALSVSHGVASLDERDARTLTFKIVSQVQTSASKGIPRATFGIEDACGNQARATIFGDAQLWKTKLAAGMQCTFLCTARLYAGQWSVTCKDLIEDRYVGGARPNYKRRGSKLDPNFLRAFVARALAIAGDEAGNQLKALLQGIGPLPDILASIGCEGWTVGQIVRQLHTPNDMAYAEHARQAMLKIGALTAHQRMGEHDTVIPAPPVRLATLNAWVSKQAHPLTTDQRNAVAGIAAELAKGRALRHQVSGDTGTGKTNVACIVSASFMDANAAHRVLVMAPTTPLAVQFRDEFERRCPGYETALVTGESGPGEGRNSRIVFGTSAVLARDLGRFDLVIIDEQQRFSVQQRERYVALQTHLIEMTATCIPRTQALAKFGRVSVSKLKQSPFPKRLHTRLWEGVEATRRLMKGIARVIAEGRPVLVVYPKRERVNKKPDKTGEDTDRHSIEAALPRWEAAFPGLVRAITSDNDIEQITSALADIETGRARVLLSTLVVEVGIDIAGLRNLVISSPQHYGLATLHQLRGRLARKGGDGYCELLVNDRITDKTRQRLDAIMATTDGFELSELDMKLRGAGDLSKESTVQSGADRTTFFGAAVPMRYLEEMHPVWLKLSQMKETSLPEASIRCH